MTSLFLSRLGGLYLNIADYGKAESLFKEALAIDQKVLGPEARNTTVDLNNLAQIYFAQIYHASASQAMDYFTKAEPLLKKSLAIRQKVFGPENPDTAQALNALGELYQYIGDFAKAEPLLKESLAIHQKVLGPEDRATMVSLNNLGLVYESMGEYAKAEPLLKESLAIHQKVLGPEHPDTALALGNLADLELDLGEIQEASQLNQAKYSLDLKMFSKILSFSSEEQRLAYQRSYLNPYTRFAALNESDGLAGAVLHCKGVVLDSIIEDRLVAETSKEEANRDLVEQLNAKKRILAQLYLQTRAASSKEAVERIQALEQEVDNIEGKLARQGTNVGQARRALGITVEQLQAVIPRDTVLVEYVRYLRLKGKFKKEPCYGAVILSADLPPRWVTLGVAEEIEASLKRYQALVRNPGDEDEMAAILRKLYSEVWEPVEQAFAAHTDRVIVSPDGQLNFLSFATLLNPEKSFIAERYSIQYVTSRRDLLRKPKSTQNKQVVVMANPNFDRDIQLASSDPPTEGAGILRGAEKRDVEDLSFEELRGTQKESAQLLLKFRDWGWQASSLAGPEASKRALLDLHGPYILHLATHGFFEPDDSSPEVNPNEIQSPETNSEFTKSRFFKNPMHRSGFALAGANTTIAAWKRGEAPPIEEDGILTAEDVSTLDLKGTWLVTLSACDTGSGEAQAGEGVMGLRRGFVEAGTQNLLMTLWPISDEVTVQIMSDFYEAAHKTGNAPEALAQVQRKWLQKLRTEKGLAQAVNLAGPFIMSSQGKP
jgi:CHAT domain-containing protein